MSLQVINKKLDIYSCSIADLTLEQAKVILSSMDKGVTLREMVLFFNPNTGEIFLNHDHPNFVKYKELTEKYLLADEFKRMEIAWNSKPADAYIIKLLKRIVAHLEIKRANQGVVDKMYLPVLEVIARNEREYISNVITAFLYGVIIGKREERRKKKVKN